MNDIAFSFQRAAAGFEPPVLLIPGLVLLIAGLFVWLSGLKAVRLVAAATAATVCGAGLGGDPLKAAAAAVVAAVLAAVFKKTAMALIAVAAAGLITSVVMAAHYDHTATSLPPAADSGRTGDQKAGLGQAVRIADFHAEMMVEHVAKIIGTMPSKAKTVPLAAAAMAVAGSVLAWRITSALAISALGMALVLAGMCLLLIYKGSVPLTIMASRPHVYAGVLATMACFGAAVQLLLCGRTDKPAQTGDENTKADRS